MNNKLEYMKCLQCKSQAIEQVFYEDNTFNHGFTCECGALYIKYKLNHIEFVYHIFKSYNKGTHKHNYYISYFNNLDESIIIENDDGNNDNDGSDVICEISMSKFIKLNKTNAIQKYIQKQTNIL